jgi:hypothetical protein
MLQSIAPAAAVAVVSSLATGSLVPVAVAFGLAVAFVGGVVIVLLVRAPGRLT